MADDVLVIGAGPAGLTAAYYLEQAGIAYRVVDRASVIGSTWTSLYPSLRLNTANFVSNLPGMPVSWRGGFYMTGRLFYEHLTAYARRHDFNVHLGVEVQRVTPDGDGWRVESSEGVAWYPAVIVATGKFGNPIMPQIEGMETFAGQALHASTFRDPQDFAGKRVLVVGNGPSGGDIAADLAQAAQPPVLLSIRSDILIARRYPYGLPETLWRVLMHPLPERWRKRLLNRLSYQSFPGLEALGLKTAPNREHRAGTSAPIRGPELYQALKAGAVRAVAGLARLEGRDAVLMDGTRHEVDVVLFATGYRPVLNYLDITFETDKDGWPVRGEGQEVAGYPGLYLVGRFYQGFGPLYNMKQEAQIAVGQIRRRLVALGDRQQREPAPSEVGS